MRKRPIVAVLLLSIAACLAPLVGSSSVQAAQCSITTTLRFGSRSEQVACLEARLGELGFGDLRGPDMFFGTTTRTQVIAFQAARGLVGDGIVGPKTRAA